MGSRLRYRLRACREPPGLAIGGESIGEAALMGESPGDTAVGAMLGVKCLGQPLA
jgi:hypothetical protein